MYGTFKKKYAEKLGDPNSLMFAKLMFRYLLTHSLCFCEFILHFFHVTDRTSAMTKNCVFQEMILFLKVNIKQF
jgi:hypothetical protein